MSHKRKKDYEAVFSKLIQLVNFPQVEEIVSDFEAAVWVTLKKLLPEVKIKGCGFHLNQAMFQNIKKIGLGPQYIRDKQCRQICRQIMSLNLLPKDKIEKRFRGIVEEVNKMENNAKMKDFCSYVDRQWIKHSIWPPATWSMFMQHRRTNNNAEGSIT
jgi:hypothetical protein